MSEPKPLDLWDIEQMLGEIMAKKQFPYCKVSAKARQEILSVLLEEVIPEIKHRIKSACEFFLRYKNNPELLIKEHPEFEDKLATFCKAYKNGRCEGGHRTFCKPSKCLFFFELVDIEKYNEWLFKLAFKDVLGEENVKQAER